MTTAAATGQQQQQTAAAAVAVPTAGGAIAPDADTPSLRIVQYALCSKLPLTKWQAQAGKQIPEPGYLSCNMTLGTM